MENTTFGSAALAVPMNWTMSATLVRRERIFFIRYLYFLILYHFQLLFTRDWKRDCNKNLWLLFVITEVKEYLQKFEQTLFGLHSTHRFCSGFYLAIQAFQHITGIWHFSRE